MHKLVKLLYVAVVDLHVHYPPITVGELAVDGHATHAPLIRTLPIFGHKHVLFVYQVRFEFVQMHEVPLAL